MTRAGQVLSRELDLYNEFWAIAREGLDVPKPKLERDARFVVLSHVPGYMPEDDDPATFPTQSEAWAYLTDEVNRYLDVMTEADVQATVISDPANYWITVQDGTALGRIWYVDSLEECDDE